MDVAEQSLIPNKHSSNKVKFNSVVWRWIRLTEALQKLHLPFKLQY